MIMEVAIYAAGLAGVVYVIRKIRIYQWGWVRNHFSLKGKLFIITGANTGLGFETTKALVKREATVIMACRNLEKANEAITKIGKDYKGQMIPLHLDLASFESIKHFISKIKTDYPKFDCLINNAGIATKEKLVTKEGFEIHFGVNHLGHFLLTNLLMDNIGKNKSRVVIVSSLKHRQGEIDFENFGKWTDKYKEKMNNNFYNNSKLANFYFARELYKKGYDCHVLCPGLCHTDFFRYYNPQWYHYIIFSPLILFFLRSAEQGAQNILYCATENVNTDEKNPATGYMVRNLIQTKSSYPFDDKISHRLWDESHKLCLVE